MKPKHILQYFKFSALSVAVTAVCVSLAGCNPVRKIENKAEQRLQVMLAPAKSYRVRLGLDMGVLKMKAQSAHIQGEAVEIRPGLVVDWLDATVQDVSQTSEGIQFAKGTYTANISQKNIEAYVLKHLPEIGSPWNKVVKRLEDVTLTVSPDGVTIALVAVTPITRLSAKVVGVPDLRLDGTVWIRAAEVHALGFNLPEPVRNAIMGQFLNRPLLDLKQMGAPISIESIVCGKAQMTITGDIDPEAARKFSAAK
ncbi:MAG: LmeA family phospholipid-binding protein [Armatimonadota bacterium]